MLTSRLRKTWLAVHITLSIGWLGALVAFVGLDVATVASSSEATLRAAYIAMELLAVWVILPLAAGAFLTGLTLSLATQWGLFRHWWVVMSLVLTLLAIAALSIQLPTIMERAELARDPATTADVLRDLGDMLLHSIAGIAVLATVVGISVFKPRGLTQYGWRKRLQAPAHHDEPR